MLILEYKSMVNSVNFIFNVMQIGSSCVSQSFYFILFPLFLSTPDILEAHYHQSGVVSVQQTYHPPCQAKCFTPVAFIGLGPSFSTMLPLLYGAHHFLFFFFLKGSLINLPTKIHGPAIRSSPDIQISNEAKF